MKKTFGIIVAALAMMVSVQKAEAGSLYYTAFYAVDAETGQRFRGGGEGMIGVAPDGEHFKTVTRFHIRHSGVGFGYTGVLNRYDADTPLKLTVKFGETEQGMPLSINRVTTVGAFEDELIGTRGYTWLTRLVLPVSYGPQLDIVDTAIADGRFTKLVAAVGAAGLEDALRGDGPLTVFAPTDDAFAALGLTDEQLLALPNLGEILLYHVVAGGLSSTDVAAVSMIETLLGKDVLVTVDAAGVKVNGANIIIKDLETSNGIIHVIDAVLIPPVLPDLVDTAIGAGVFTKLVAALEATGLDVVLRGEGPFTVFAPTDDAFAALGLTDEQLLALPNLADILKYHVLAGRVPARDVVVAERLRTLLDCDVKVSVVDGEVFINNAKIEATDIKAENGIVHIINAVLLPPTTPDIVDTAIDAGVFSTLVAAVQLAGLEDTLRSPGPFTVFAPTDDAFAALPSWLLNRLLERPDALAEVLKYHVVAGDLDAGEVAEKSRIQTVQGASIYPRVYGDHVYVNRSKVIDADIEAKNGTIHVIDRVLLPWWIWWYL